MLTWHCSSPWKAPGHRWKVLQQFQRRQLGMQGLEWKELNLAISSAPLLQTHCFASHPPAAASLQLLNREDFFKGNLKKNTKTHSLVEANFWLFNCSQGRGLKAHTSHPCHSQQIPRCTSRLLYPSQGYGHTTHHCAKVSTCCTRFYLPPFSCFFYALACRSATPKDLQKNTLAQTSTALTSTQTGKLVRSFPFCLEYACMMGHMCYFLNHKLELLLSACTTGNPWGCTSISFEGVQG